MVRRPESCWYEFRPVAALRQLSLRDPHSVEMATTSTEYNEKARIIRTFATNPLEKTLANRIKRAHGLTMHNNQAGPEPFAERASS